jgi:hypothetical protein
MGRGKPLDPKNHPIAKPNKKELKENSAGGKRLKVPRVTTDKTKS